jgi:hypothetical protein
MVGTDWHTTFLIDKKIRGLSYKSYWVTSPTDRRHNQQAFYYRPADGQQLLGKVQKAEYRAYDIVVDEHSNDNPVLFDLIF